MKTIIFFHQSADLYGSDRVLISLIEGLDKSRFRPIVLIPCIGPLSDALTIAGIEIHIIPLVKVSRATFTPLGLLKLPFEVVNSIRAINRVLAGIKVDMVHSNTIAVLSGALWARLYGRPHLWHVHEIIVHPRLARRLFPFLVRLLADRVVANSETTRQWLVSTERKIAPKTVTIWNGVERTSSVKIDEVFSLRSTIGLGPEDVLVVLIGRINRWKGQALLVKAAEDILKKNNSIHFLIVGSPPLGQEHFRVEILKQIAESSASKQITVWDFTEDVWMIWDACDIAVVPSIEPEPFGMVAIEAMASGKPVIGSAHGGLTEIVEDGETGFLIMPNDTNALAEAILKLAESPSLRNTMGTKGALRQFKYFSLQSYQTSFTILYKELAK